MGNAVNIAFWCILPYSYQYAPLLLPCAIGNGIAAGGAYAALDVMGGGPASKLLKNPLIAGGGIGAFVGLVAPSLLYGPVCSTLYGIEHMGLFLNQAFTEFPYIMQISVTTGFAAGIAMYPMLHYPIYGVPNVPWQALTGAVLLGTGVALHHVYGFGDDDNIENRMPLEDGRFVSSKEVPLLDSILRYDVEDDNFKTYSLKENEYVGGADMKEKGRQIADDVRKYRDGGWLTEGGITFDNQVLTVLYEYLDQGIAERFKDNIVTVKDVKELQDFEERMYRSDWVVKNIMERFRRGKKSNTHDEDARMKALNIDKLKSYGVMSERERGRRLENIASTAVAVELLLLLRQAENYKNTLTFENALKHPNARHLITTSIISQNKGMPSISELETFIRKRAPGILLYTDDEKLSDSDGLRGQSVESQLKRMSWDSSTLDVHAVLGRWEELCGKETTHHHIRKGALFAFGLFASYLQSI